MYVVAILRTFLLALAGALLAGAGGTQCTLAADGDALAFAGALGADSVKCQSEKFRKAREPLGRKDSGFRRVRRVLMWRTVLVDVGGEPYSDCSLAMRMRVRIRCISSIVKGVYVYKGRCLMKRQDVERTSEQS